MNSTRKIAAITGVIFIIATLLGPILASSLVPVLTGADYLTQFSAQPNQVAAGVLLIAHLRFACGWHSRRDVSSLEEVECGPSPWFCCFQDH